jgi:hypothetical protein
MRNINNPLISARTNKVMPHHRIFSPKVLASRIVIIF